MECGGSAAALLLDDEREFERYVREQLNREKREQSLPAAGKLPYSKLFASYDALK
jgi:hypothetical protein